MQAPRNLPPLRRFLVLGPGGDGKSTLIVRYVQNIFITEYDPTSASHVLALSLHPIFFALGRLLLRACWRFERCCSLRSPITDRSRAEVEDEYRKMVEVDGVAQMLLIMCASFLSPSRAKLIGIGIGSW